MNTDTIIDQAFNDAPQTDVVETPIENASEVVQDQTDETIVKTEEEWPKKARNAVSYRDKKIGKYQAELAAARAELAKYQQPQQIENKGKPHSKDGAPSEADFDNYGEFLIAQAKYAAREELKGERQRHEETQRTAQEREWVSKREEAVAEQAQQLLESNPEYAQILAEHSDLLDAMPPHIERAFLEADNAPMAFAVLAKEGKLEGLMTMSPYKAAMEIAKAEDRGAALSKPKVTSAPKPMASAKGTGPSSKGLQNMTAKELTAWARS